MDGPDARAALAPGIVRSMTAMDRLLIGALALWTLGCVAYMGMRMVKDPFVDRSHRMEAHLGEIEPPPGPDAASEDEDRRFVRMVIMQKESLWKELVPAPPKPKAPKPPPPNLEKMLQGVRPSLREEIRIGDARHVRIRQQESGEGPFMTIGDRIRGLTIVDIRDDVVVFELKKGGETYTHELKRK